MNNFFLKLNIIILLLISSKINGMMMFNSILALNHFIKPFTTHSKDQYLKEYLAVKKAVDKLKKNLLEQKITNYEISITSRRQIHYRCSLGNCLYPRWVIKDNKIFGSDPKAPCLCTRHSKFDTPGHIIQAINTTEPKLK